jgi:hypothetical protein
MHISREDKYILYGCYSTHPYHLLHPTSTEFCWTQSTCEFIKLKVSNTYVDADLSKMTHFLLKAICFKCRRRKAMAVSLQVTTETITS